MSESTTLTPRQAKGQMNTFGFALVIYVIALTLYRHGTNLIIENAPELFMGYDPQVVVNFCFIPFLLLVSFVPFFIVTRLLGFKVRKYMKKPKLTFGKFLIGLCLGIAIYFFVSSISSVFGFIMKSADTSVEFLGDFRSTRLIMLNVIYFIYTGIVLPICDEYVFRGVIQRALGHFGRGFGVVASAALYALAQGSLIEALPAFFFGWYMSILAIRYHSLWPSILIHIGTSLFFLGMNLIPAAYSWVILVLVFLVYVVSIGALLFRKVNAKISYSMAWEPTLWKLLFSCSTIWIVVLVFIFNVAMSFIK